MEIKFPKIKLDYNDEEIFSLGKLSPALIIGFGFHWAWVYLTMFSGETIFFANEIHAHDTAKTFYLASLIVFVSTFFLYAIASRPLRIVFRTRKARLYIRFGGAVFASLGTLMLYFASIDSAFGMTILITGALISGIGSVVLLMSYGVSFGQCDTATIVTTTALALVFGMLVYAILLGASSFVALPVIIITAGLPFVDCYCLYKISSLYVDKLEFSLITLKVKKVRFGVRICAPSLLFGFALGTLRSLSLNEALQIEQYGMLILIVIAAGILACTVMLAAMHTQKQALNFLFRPLIPIITLSLLLYFFSSHESSAYMYLLLLAGYMLFESVMWINYGDISQRFRLTAFIVYGFGRGSLALGALIGSWMMDTRGFGTFDVNSLIMISLSCLLIGYILLPRSSEIRNLIIGESDKPAENNKTEKTDEESITYGRFKQKCETIANRYLLSKKETEVLYLLAKGRNAAHIQEKLFISEGTARTHMRHIYKKVDIHSQQELIDMIDEVSE